MKADKREGLADGISIKSCEMRRLWGHGEPRLCRSAHLRNFLSTSCLVPLAFCGAAGKTSNPRPSTCSLWQTPAISHSNGEAQGERLGRRGKGGERGTFSRLSEHPTAAAAVSQMRRRGHPPSGGKKKEQRSGGERVRARQRNRTRLTRENKQRLSSDEIEVSESSTSCLAFLKKKKYIFFLMGCSWPWPSLVTC